MNAMDHDEARVEILKAELELTQAQMDKYDQLSTTTKTRAITLWVAAPGWSFQVARSEVAPLSVVVLFAFWCFDGLNKTFRQNYKRRRDEVGKPLEYFFRDGALPEGTTAPKLPVHAIRLALSNLFSAHVTLPYAILALISLFIAVQL